MQLQMLTHSRILPCNTLKEFEHEYQTMECFEKLDSSNRNWDSSNSTSAGFFPRSKNHSFNGFFPFGKPRPSDIHGSCREICLLFQYRSADDLRATHEGADLEGKGSDFCAACGSLEERKIKQVVGGENLRLTFTKWPKEFGVGILMIFFAYC